MTPTLLKQDVEGLKKRHSEVLWRYALNAAGILEKDSSKSRRSDAEQWPLPNVKNPRRLSVAGKEFDDKIPDDISQL